MRGPQLRHKMSRLSERTSPATALAGALTRALAEETVTCCTGFRKKFSQRGKVARGRSQTGVFTRVYPRNAATCRLDTSRAQL